ncbi:hypothetical protein GPALN_012373 [Globodera pallida]|nr:hypothetical protein GPALN_012373 [Globodera pallida]
MCTTRKQRAGESIPIYAENISQLVDKAYPDGAGFNAQVRRELTVDLFRNGLKMSIREQLRHKTKPNSLHEAIQEAIEEDEAQNEIAREKLSSAQTSIGHRQMWEREWHKQATQKEYEDKAKKMLKSIANTFGTAISRNTHARNYQGKF